MIPVPPPVLAVRPPPPVQKPAVSVFVWFLVAGVTLAILIGLYVSFSMSHAPDPSHVTQADINQLVVKVGTLILLPQGEEPTIATVTDLNALKDQAFFSHAHLGDKVLMYPKAGQAILYSPDLNKIIQVGPITVGKK